MNDGHVPWWVWWVLVNLNLGFYAILTQVRELELKSVQRTRGLRVLVMIVCAGLGAVVFGAVGIIRWLERRGLFLPGNDREFE
jgi:hypothetical protein